MRRMAALTAILQLAMVAVASAQSFDGLAIWFQGMTIASDGGERFNSAAGASPLVLGKTDRLVLSQMPDQCGFNAKHNGDVQANAIAGWVADVTPVRVQTDAVTFRLQWNRRSAKGRGAAAANGDVELTLRPGESMPIDSLPVAPETVPASCQIRAVSVRVKADYPARDIDTRVLATDMWLVDRAPDGTERVQQLSLRSRPNESVPFFFDTLVADDRSLIFDGDMSAEVVPDHPDEVLVRFTIRKHVLRPRTGATTLDQVSWARVAQPTVRLRPETVARIDLAPLADNNAGRLNDHTFSIRFRTRQIR